MPASVRLLQKLQETWGDEVTQDFVTWVSEAQSVNRAELRELADLYFARFGDRLDERIAVLEERIAAAEARWQAALARLEGRLDAGLAGLRADVAVQMRDQMKWMFVFWIGTLVPLAGLIIGLARGWL